MVIASKLRLLDPVEEPTIEPNSTAPRLDSLDGKVIGLYANTKYKAVELLDMVEDELHERYDIKGIVRGRYNTGRLMREDEWHDTEQCDAIILTHGD